MKKFLFILIIICSSRLQGQNLVPNPSFEEYTNCPYQVGHFNGFVKNWTSFSESPDYFNICSDTTYLTVPYTHGGYQYPATGNAFCGVFTLSCGDFRYREAIGCHLIAPLKIGTEYFCSFKVCFGYAGSLSPSYIASNGIGIKFSTKPYIIYTNHPIQIDNKPHIYSKEIITDTLNWTEISGSFIADSAYKYLVIANFFDIDHTDTLHLGSFNCHSYYFVDDVCVSGRGGCNFNNIDKLNNSEFSIFPNPANKQINIKSPKNITSIEIYNLLGAIYYSSAKMVKKNDEIFSINCSQFPKGIYFIKLNYENTYKINKIIIN